MGFRRAVLQPLDSKLLGEPRCESRIVLLRVIGRCSDEICDLEECGGELVPIYSVMPFSPESRRQRDFLQPWATIENSHPHINDFEIQ